MDNTNIFSVIWEAIITFFKSDIPEEIIGWCNGVIMSFVEMIRNIMDMFIN